MKNFNNFTNDKKEKNISESSSDFIGDEMYIKNSIESFVDGIKKNYSNIEINVDEDENGKAIFDIISNNINDIRNINNEYFFDKGIIKNNGRKLYVVIKYDDII